MVSHVSLPVWPPTHIALAWKEWHQRYFVKNLKTKSFIFQTVIPIDGSFFSLASSGRYLQKTRSHVGKFADYYHLVAIYY